MRNVREIRPKISHRRIKIVENDKKFVGSNPKKLNQIIVFIF